MTNLERITLNNCFVTDDLMLKLANNLPKCGITYLDLSFNIIGDIGATALSAVLPLCGIQNVNLKGNRIDTLGLKSLCSSLQHSKVQLLDISANKFEIDDYHLLYQALPKCQLVKLSGMVYGPKSIIAITKYLPTSQISEIEVDVRTEYMELFVKSVSKSKIKKLTINGYLPIQGSAIPHSLNSLPIYHLVLKFASFGEHSVVLFNNIQNSNVHHLYIRDTTLKHQGLARLQLEGLLTLTFGLCEFPENALGKLIPAIIQSGLRKLIFEGDLFSKESIIDFLRVVRKSRLRYLKIGYKGNDKAQMRREIRAVLDNSDLRVII
ncbi:hypothetical protein HDV06_002740 [Boothiomyces sp. JEL0866]|nr:hypothetical protein HDV06_002740 [Boothiomyces sp. JEL0866]